MIVWYIIGGFLLIAGLVLAAILFNFFNIWLTAKATGAPVSILEMCFMRLRGSNPRFIILDCYITLLKAGIDIEVSDLEKHYLCGGRLDLVVGALISAAKAGLEVDFAKIAAIDLAGRNVVDAVETHVNPKVVQCPAPNSELDHIAGVCQDGIRLACKARITVRTLLSKIVGGAGEETVVARVGEGIVTAFGRTKSHKEILASPEKISDYLLGHGLDSGTCFEIVSVDIADVDVVDNIGARLQSDRAEADKRIAQAQAEIRRAAAVASTQEMKAKTTGMKGRVTSAKSTIPLAVSSAVQDQNMGRSKPLLPHINHGIRWKK